MAIKAKKTQEMAQIRIKQLDNEPSPKPTKSSGSLDSYSPKG